MEYDYINDPDNAYDIWRDEQLEKEIEENGEDYIEDFFEDDIKEE